MSVCPRAPGASIASWTVNPARPEATLFQRSALGQQFQMAARFLSPDANPNGIQNPTPFGNATWQSSFDSSRIWAAVLNGNSIAPSANEPSCPNSGSIPCLLPPRRCRAPRQSSLEQNHFCSAAQHQRRSRARRRLLHVHRCGQSGARAVHRRLLLLPQGSVK